MTGSFFTHFGMGTHYGSSATVAWQQLIFNWGYISPGSMYIVGHRGARSPGPENTCKAVRYAMRCAEYVEVDIRLSRDRVPVIMHDPTIDRTTNGSGRVADMTYGELSALDAGEGEHVPSLMEVCSLVRGICGLFVEIKEPGSELEVCKILDKEAPSPLLVVSFHRASLEMVSEMLPGTATGFIYSRPVPDAPTMASRKNIRLILPRSDLLTPELVADAQSRDIEVVPWTLDDLELWEKAKKMGVDGFVSDNPCSARQWLEGAG